PDVTTSSSQAPVPPGTCALQPTGESSTNCSNPGFCNKLTTVSCAETGRIKILPRKTVNAHNLVTLTTPVIRMLITSVHLSKGHVIVVNVRALPGGQAQHDANGHHF